MRKLREGWGGEIWGKWLAELYSWGGHPKPQWGAEDATGAVTISLPCVFTLSFKIVLILTYLNMLSLNYQSIILCTTQYQTDYISERNRRKFGGWMKRLKFHGQQRTTGTRGVLRGPCGPKKRHLLFTFQFFLIKFFFPPTLCSFLIPMWPSKDPWPNLPWQLHSIHSTPYMPWSALHHASYMNVKYTITCWIRCRIQPFPCARKCMMFYIVLLLDMKALTKWGV